MNHIRINPDARGKLVTLTEAKKFVVVGSPVVASHLLIGSTYHIACWLCRTPEELKAFVLEVRGNRFLKGVAYFTCKEAWRDYGGT
jgi:hypothetical protein